MRDYLNYNDTQITLLIQKINYCRMHNKKFRIVFIDIDDTINNSEPIVQRQLKKINYKATDEYRASIMKKFTSEDEKMYTAESYDILNQVLEDRGIYHGRIDYEEIHSRENLFPNSIDYINYMLENRGKELFNYTGYEEQIGEEVEEYQTFYVELSHYNPIREANLKIQKYYEYSPYLDAILTCPFYDSKRQMSSKALHVIRTLGLTVTEFRNCVLIDNSSRNLRDWKSYGGIAIPYFPSGYPTISRPTNLELETEEERKDRELAEFNHLRSLESLDPFYLQFVMSAIMYDREQKLDTINVQQKVKKIKR